MQTCYSNSAWSFSLVFEIEIDKKPLPSSIVLLPEEPSQGYCVMLYQSTSVVNGNRGRSRALPKMSRPSRHDVVSKISRGLQLFPQNCAWVSLLVFLRRSKVIVDFPLVKSWLWNLDLARNISNV